jgi:hypothetical protein
MTNIRSLNDLPNSAANPLLSDSINPTQVIDMKHISVVERGFSAGQSVFSLLSGKTREGADLFGAQADGRRPEVLFEMG